MCPASLVVCPTLSAARHTHYPQPSGQTLLPAPLTEEKARGKEVNLPRFLLLLRLQGPQTTTHLSRLAVGSLSKDCHDLSHTRGPRSWQRQWPSPHTRLWLMAEGGRHTSCR